MKYLKHILLNCLGLCCFYSAAFSQQTNDSLLLHRWRFTTVEADGKSSSFPEKRSSGFSFYSGNKAECKQACSVSSATWRYDAATKTLTLISASEQINFKVLSLTTDKCVLEYTNKEGQIMKIQMVHEG